MKFEVYKEKTDEEVSLIDFRKGANGHPALLGVDAVGSLLPKSVIVSVTERGTLHRHTDCEVPGIQTDELGRVVID